MAAVRSCVCLLVLLVNLQVAVSKPFLDWLMCDLLCSDEDITASTTSTTDDDDPFGFDCGICPMPPTPAKPPQSISVNLPSIPNGMRMNVTDNNGVMTFVLNAVDQAPAGTGGTMSVIPASPAGNDTAPGNSTAAG